MIDFRFVLTHENYGQVNETKYKSVGDGKAI